MIVRIRKYISTQPCIIIGFIRESRNISAQKCYVPRRAVKGGARRQQFKDEQAQGPGVNGVRIIVECLQARVHQRAAYDDRLQVRAHVLVQDG